MYPPPLIDRSAVLHIERDLAALAWSFVAASQYDPQGLPLNLHQNSFGTAQDGGALHVQHGTDSGRAQPPDKGGTR